MFLTRLLLQIRPCITRDEYLRHGLNEINHEKNEDILDVDEVMKMRNFIKSVLAHREVLIVMDNAEDPLEEDGT